MTIAADLVTVVAVIPPRILSYCDKSVCINIRYNLRSLKTIRMGMWDMACQNFQKVRDTNIAGATGKTVYVVNVIVVILIDIVCKA